jgi:hypothetical protein
MARPMKQRDIPDEKRPLSDAKIKRMEWWADFKTSLRWNRDKNPVEWIVDYNARLTEITNYVLRKNGTTMDEEYENWQKGEVL